MLKVKITAIRKADYKDLQLHMKILLNTHAMFLKVRALFQLMQKDLTDSVTQHGILYFPLSRNLPMVRGIFMTDG